MRACLLVTPSLTYKLPPYVRLQGRLNLIVHPPVGYLSMRAFKLVLIQLLTHL
jgi:hypothetical protein